SLIPAARRPASASSASGSLPTAPTSRTRAPSRAAATAWFAPLPPGKRSKALPARVSPGRGSRATRATRSRLIDPTTVRAGPATVRDYSCDEGAPFSRRPLGSAGRVVERSGRCGHRFGEQAVQLSPAAGLGAIRHVELAIDVREVELHRLLGHPEHAGKLPVRMAFGDELQDLELTLREPRLVLRRLLPDRRHVRGDRL